MKFDWDPEIDTPATVAVLGGGPVGVEAALYARFLGYFVMLFDSAKVGDSLLGWGQHPIFSESESPATWREATTPLGLAAIEAQAGVDALPDLESSLNYRQFVEQYLLPLARTDLLYESIQVHAPVLSVSRQGCDSTDSMATERRAEQEFRILARSKNRGEYSQLADVVLDCTGSNSRRRGLASGGGLAIGEQDFAEKMLFGKRDILGKKRQQFAGKHMLMFGSDLAACANAVDFSQLVKDDPNTRLSWIVTKRIGSQPVLDAHETLATQQLMKAAVELRSGDVPGIVPIGAWGIEALAYSENRWGVKLQSTEEETLDLSADVFINCARAIPDWSHTQNLLVANTLESGFATQEPHYYVLGQKRLSTKLTSSGDGGPAPLTIAESHQQIREVFALIGGRNELDLYGTVKPST